MTIAASTEFAARAYRPAPGGSPLDADDFEINGTRFSPTTYGWFYQRPFLPAVQVDDAGPQHLEQGLRFDYLQAPWYRLDASAHWLPATSGGTVDREMDLSKLPRAQSDGQPYAVRFAGYLRVPEDGVYTFHAPHELVYMDDAPSYDLRVYVDGQEWYLTQWWHGHGTWSVPLRKGLHAFQVDFAGRKRRGGKGERLHSRARKRRKTRAKPARKAG